MTTPNLTFNVLTFTHPTENQTMYFSKECLDKCHPIHKSIFPVNIDSIFPGISKNCTENIFTTFTGEKKGFQPLSIDLNSENPDFIKRFYNRKINFYFRYIQKQIVKVGFIKDNQIWVHSKKYNTAQSDVYKKFSLKVQLKTVSNFPELMLSYDGQSKVLKQSVAELINQVSPTCFNWVLQNSQFHKWEYLTEEDVPDYDQCFPVLNKKLQVALNIPTEAPPKDNRYIKYLEKISAFYKHFLNKKEFREIIPIHDTGFIEVNPIRVNTTSEESNSLLFENGSGIVPKFGIRDLKPFKASPYNKIHLFFILHSDDKAQATKIKKYFKEGFLWFKGLYKYAHILFHTEEGFSIVFTDKENPVSEIEQKLSERIINPEVKYIAIYITPYSKFEQDKEKREIYYKVKELLLKRKITSQAIDPAKMEEQGEGWVYSLPNIAVAILAKLDGIP